MYGVKLQLATEWMKTMKIAKTCCCTLVVFLCMAAGAQTCTSPDVVTYEEFGAVGDGKTDDQKAIVAAHAAANKRKLPVRAGDGKTYYIGGGAKVAVIKTDVDFGTAKFVIDDRNLENVKAPVFRVDPSARSFEVKGVKTLARGQAKLGVSLPGTCLVEAVNGKVRQYIRYGLNQNKGSPQKEVFLVAADGTIDPATPIVWDYAEVTRLTAHPVDAKTLTIKGGRFTTIANQAESTYNYHARGIVVRRSNVRIEGLRHDVTGEGDHGAPYGSFVGASYSANVLVTNCVFTAHKTYRTIGAAGKPTRSTSPSSTAARRPTSTTDATGASSARTTARTSSTTAARSRASTRTWALRTRRSATRGSGTRASTRLDSARFSWRTQRCAAVRSSTCAATMAVPGGATSSCATARSCRVAGKRPPARSFKASARIGTISDTNAMRRAGSCSTAL